MADGEKSDQTTPERSPEQRRSVSRRGFLTQEVSKAGIETVRHLPTFGGLLGFVLKETSGQHESRMVDNLWQLLMGRTPKAKESAAGLDLVRNAKTPDEKGDALVDILWALCQTEEFHQLNRPDLLLVRGLYKIALDREPNAEEQQAALEVLSGAEEPAARSAALEGLFTGLIRSWESVLRKAPNARR